MGMGWGWGKLYGDGVGMRLIFLQCHSLMLKSSYMGMHDIKMYKAQIIIIKMASLDCI